MIEKRQTSLFSEICREIRLLTVDPDACLRCSASFRYGSSRIPRSQVLLPADAGESAFIGGDAVLASELEGQLSAFQKIPSDECTVSTHSCIQFFIIVKNISDKPVNDVYVDINLIV